MRNIEQHAADNVNKILVGNKCDMDESKRAVPTSRGKALADEFGIPFFETSAKSNINVVSLALGKSLNLLAALKVRHVICTGCPFIPSYAMRILGTLIILS